VRIDFTHIRTVPRQTRASGIPRPVAKSGPQPTVRVVRSTPFRRSRRPCVAAIECPGIWGGGSRHAGAWEYPRFRFHVVGSQPDSPPLNVFGGI